MEFSVTTTGEQTELVLNGDLQIMHANEMRDVLLQQLTAVQNLAINLTDITNIDVCGFQLLYATRLSAKKMSKNVVFNTENAAVLREIAAENGFSLDRLIQQ